MSINKLYFSHSKYNWSSYNVTLLNNKNLNKELANTSDKDYATSIADIRFENVKKVINEAKEIVLVDINFLKTGSISIDEDYFVYGRLLNELYKVREKVKNFDWIDDLNYQSFNNLVATRQIDKPVLWTVGCSVTFGIGVLAENRWGSIVSNALSRSEITLSKPGHSIAWCADQILRSDIKPGDIVVWGLTDISRVEYASNWQLNAVPVTGYTQLPDTLQHYKLDYFDSQTKFVMAIKNVLQVVNYCKKIGVELYLINLMDTTYFKIVFDNMHNYIDCAAEKTYYKYDDPLDFIDVGSDGKHPGPKQHQYYAEQILNLIKENNHGKTF